MLVIPLDQAGQSFGVVQSQLADAGQALVGEGLFYAVAIGEYGGFLLSQVHVEAGIAQVGHRQRGKGQSGCSFQNLPAWDDCSEQ